MEKAKSRLHSQVESAGAASSASSVTKNTPSPVVHPHQKSKPRLFFRYLRQTHTLLIGLGFYYLIYLILTKVEPDHIKNFLLTNIYLPLLIFIFFGNFFVISFLFLNSKQGFFLSFFILIIIFLRLQQVIFEVPLILGLGTVFVIWALLTAISWRRSQRHS